MKMSRARLGLYVHRETENRWYNLRINRRRRFLLLWPQVLVSV
jgi:hypothetical protein